MDMTCLPSDSQEFQKLLLDLQEEMGDIVYENNPNFTLPCEHIHYIEATSETTSAVNSILQLNFQSMTELYSEPTSTLTPQPISVASIHANAIGNEENISENIDVEGTKGKRKLSSNEEISQVKRIALDREQMFAVRRGKNIDVEGTEKRKSSSNEEMPQVKRIALDRRGKNIEQCMQNVGSAISTTTIAEAEESGQDEDEVKLKCTDRKRRKRRSTQTFKNEKKLRTKTLRKHRTKPIKTTIIEADDTEDDEDNDQQQSTTTTTTSDKCIENSSWNKEEKTKMQLRECTCAITKIESKVTLFDTFPNKFEKPSVKLLKNMNNLGSKQDDETKKGIMMTNIHLNFKHSKYNHDGEKKKKSKTDEIETETDNKIRYTRLTKKSVLVPPKKIVISDEQPLTTSTIHYSPKYGLIPLTTIIQNVGIKHDLENFENNILFIENESSKGLESMSRFNIDACKERKIIINNSCYSPGEYRLVLGAIPNIPIIIEYVEYLLLKWHEKKTNEIRKKKDCEYLIAGELEMKAFLYWKLVTDDIVTNFTDDDIVMSGLKKLINHACYILRKGNKKKKKESKADPRLRIISVANFEDTLHVSSSLLMQIKIEYNNIMKIIEDDLKLKDEPRYDYVKTIWHNVMLHARLYHYRSPFTEDVINKEYNVLKSQMIFEGQIANNCNLNYYSGIKFKRPDIVSLLHYIISKQSQVSKDLERACGHFYIYFCILFCNYIIDNSICIVKAKIVKEHVGSFLQRYNEFASNNSKKYVVRIPYNRIPWFKSFICCAVAKGLQKSKITKVTIEDDAIIALMWGINLFLMKQMEMIMNTDAKHAKPIPEIICHHLDQFFNNETFTTITRMELWTLVNDPYEDSMNESEFGESGSESGDDSEMDSDSDLDVDNDEINDLENDLAAWELAEQSVSLIKPPPKSRSQSSYEKKVKENCPRYVRCKDRLMKKKSNAKCVMCNRTHTYKLIDVMYDKEPNDPNLRVLCCDKCFTFLTLSYAASTNQFLKYTYQKIDHDEILYRLIQGYLPVLYDEEGDFIQNEDIIDKRHSYNHFTK